MILNLLFNLLLIFGVLAEIDALLWFFGKLFMKFEKTHRFGVYLYSASAYSDLIHEHCQLVDCAKCKCKKCLRNPLHKHRRITK